MSVQRIVERYPDRQTLMRAAAERFVELANEAIASRGRFSVALSGGSTPRDLHKLISESYADKLDWSRVHVFWGDERTVPPDDAQSNYRMARETLLDQVPIPTENVHRMRGEISPTAAADEYERDVDEFFGPDGRFDLILLGMGDDGHTASLFPGLSAVHENSRRVVAENVPKVGMWRISLTPRVINAAREVEFLVVGADKAATLPRVLEGPFDPDTFPSQIVRPTNGTLRWMVDESAASGLTQSPA